MHISCLSVIGVIACYQRTAAKNEGQQHKFLMVAYLFYPQTQATTRTTTHTKRVTLIKIAGK